MPKGRGVKYKTLSLNAAMLDEIAQLIEEWPGLGFTSMSGFVTHCIRSNGDYRNWIEKKVKEEREGKNDTE